MHWVMNFTIFKGSHYEGPTFLSDLILRDLPQTHIMMIFLMGHGPSQFLWRGSRGDLTRVPSDGGLLSTPRDVLHTSLRPSG